jgi:transposase
MSIDRFNCRFDSLRTLVTLRQAPWRYIREHGQTVEAARWTAPAGGNRAGAMDIPGRPW